MRRSPLALATLVLTVLLGNSLGRTQPIEPAQPAALRCRDDPECARLLDAGKEHSKAERLQEAQRFYEQAYQRRADPQLLFNIARVIHRAGHPAAAVSYYQMYLDAGADGDETQKHKTVEYLEQARRESAVPPPPLVPPPPVTPAQPAKPPPPRLVAPIAVPMSPMEARHGTPIYRKWWLWTGVGVAVAGIAVGVGLAVAAHRPDVSDAAMVRAF